MKKPPVKAQAGGTAPKMDGKSSFLAAFKKSPKLAQKLKHVTDAKDPNAKPEIDDGTYATKISDVRFADYNGVPQAKVFFVVTKGPAKGVILNRKYDFGKTSPNGPDEEEILTRIGVDLERMGSKPEAPTGEAMLDAFSQLASEKPEIQVNVKTSASGYVNVYVNRRLEPVAAEEGEPEDENAPDDPEEQAAIDEDEGDDDEGSETEGPEDDNEIPVEVEDLVKYTPPGSKKSVKCEVVKTDVKSKVCFLKTEDGTKTFKAVPWSSVEFVMEGE